MGGDVLKEIAELRRRARELIEEARRLCDESARVQEAIRQMEGRVRKNQAESSNPPPCHRSVVEIIRCPGQLRTV